MTMMKIEENLLYELQVLSNLSLLHIIMMKMIIVVMMMTIMIIMVVVLMWRK